MNIENIMDEILTDIDNMSLAELTSELEKHSYGPIYHMMNMLSQFQEVKNNAYELLKEDKYKFAQTIHGFKEKTMNVKSYSADMESFCSMLAPDSIINHYRSDDFSMAA